MIYYFEWFAQSRRLPVIDGIIYDQRICNYELSMCVINRVYNKLLIIASIIISNRSLFKNYFVVMDYVSIDMTDLLIERYLRKKDIGKDTVVVVNEKGVIDDD